jgi:hypothetical protein
MFQYFGPAMFPSLVIWPIRITGILVSLANLISSAVVSWDIPCGRFDIIGMKGLNRINDYNFGLDRFNLFEDVLGFGFGKDVAVVTGRVILSALILFVFGFLPETYVL